MKYLEIFNIIYVLFIWFMIQNTTISQVFNPFSAIALEQSSLVLTPHLEKKISRRTAHRR